MKKRGSLSLSTNAIVVLIIAITILGLALAFTRNIFGSLGKQIEDIGKQTLIENPPTFEKPMTLSKEEFDVRRGKTVSLGVGFYNRYDKNVTAMVDIYSCQKAGTDTLSYFTMTSPGAKRANINEAVSYSTSIGAGEAAPSGVHACTIAITAAPIGGGADLYEYKDVLITIK